MKISAIETYPVGAAGAGDLWRRGRLSRRLPLVDRARGNRERHRRLGRSDPGPAGQYLRDARDDGDHGATNILRRRSSAWISRRRDALSARFTGFATVIRLPKPRWKSRSSTRWENCIDCRSAGFWAARIGAKSSWSAAWGWISGRKLSRVRARELKRDGVQTFKIKIGQPDHQQDIERVRAVREAVGEDASIRVDGNAAYSFADARYVLNELSRYHITDAEQPLARGDLRSLAELRRAVGISIAAQESVSSPEDALAVLEQQAADLLKIKLTHIGGFERAREVAAVVGAKGPAGRHRPGKRMHDDSFRGGNASALRAKKRPTRRRDDRFHAPRRAGYF